jgi:hypothetical protein
LHHQNSEPSSRIEQPTTLGTYYSLSMRRANKDMIKCGSLNPTLKESLLKYYISMPTYLSQFKQKWNCDARVLVRDQTQWKEMGSLLMRATGTSAKIWRKQQFISTHKHFHVFIEKQNPIICTFSIESYGLI